MVRWWWWWWWWWWRWWWCVCGEGGRGGGCRACIKLEPTADLTLPGHTNTRTRTHELEHTNSTLRNTPPIHSFANSSPREGSGTTYESPGPRLWPPSPVNNSRSSLGITGVWMGETLKRTNLPTNRPTDQPTRPTDQPTNRPTDRSTNPVALRSYSVGQSLSFA